MQSSYLASLAPAPCKNFPKVFEIALPDPHAKGFSIRFELRLRVANLKDPRSAGDSS